MFLCMEDCVMGIVLYMTVRKCEYLCCEMYLSGCELSLKVVVVLMWNRHTKRLASVSSILDGTKCLNLAITPIVLLIFHVI